MIHNFKKGKLLYLLFPALNKKLAEWNQILYVVLY